MTYLVMSPRSSRMATLNEPVRLSGLKQAVNIMDCITAGQTKDQIAIALGGDVQLVEMWLSFLQHNHWMIEGAGGWSVTAKGAMWSKSELAKTD